MWCWREAHGAAVTLTLVGLTVVLELGAGFALVVIRAAAVEVSHKAAALGPVVTGVWTARVVLHLRTGRSKDVFLLRVKCSSILPSGSSPHLTACTREASGTFTHESFQQGVAAAVVPTRAAGTAVSLNLTVPAHESRLASTAIASGQLLTQRHVLCGRRERARWSRAEVIYSDK